MLESKLPTGKSGTKRLHQDKFAFSLLWMSQCVACSPAWWILYHVTASCKGPIPDNNNNGFVLLENKDYVKFLGVLIDKNLTWKPHIDHVASKMSKIVGILARIRHHVPLNILLQIYRSLIFPYKLYGIPVWGQAAQRDLEKILILQKRALRLIFFQQKISCYPSFNSFEHSTC